MTDNPDNYGFALYVEDPVVFNSLRTMPRITELSVPHYLHGPAYDWPEWAVKLVDPKTFDWETCSPVSVSIRNIKNCPDQWNPLDHPPTIWVEVDGIDPRYVGIDAYPKLPEYLRRFRQENERLVEMLANGFIEVDPNAEKLLSDLNAAGNGLGNPRVWNKVSAPMFCYAAGRTLLHPDHAPGIRTLLQFFQKVLKDKVSS